MRSPALRVFALVLCLMLPAAALADTYLSREDAVHVDFTLGVGLHADGFPESRAHLKDWETFFKRIDLRGSLDGQAFLEPESRVYLDGALRIDGKDTIPFIYDGYHSYRYLVSPMFMNDPIHFQMHNFFDFMLKPYYFMELPTQYLALFLYPNSTYFIADSFYTPVREMLDEARGEALAEADDRTNELAYTIPYERLFELCETLDYVTTDDELSRVYAYFDTMLAEIYASSAMTDTLSSLETVLDALDPEEQGMLVTETAGGLTCSFGDTEVFSKTVSGSVTGIHVRLPIPQDYWVTADYRCETTENGNEITASLTAEYGGETEFSLALAGSGLPAGGALSGAGSVTAALGGSLFEEIPAPQTLQFQWSRTASELPYDLNLTVDWLHPETGLPALSLYFSGVLSARDKSVFKEVWYPQNDFFSLNDMFLREYKERWTPTISAYLLPVVLEMPLGVIDDLVNYGLEKDILISLME